MVGEFFFSRHFTLTDKRVGFHEAREKKNLPTALRVRVGSGITPQPRLPRFSSPPSNVIIISAGYMTAGRSFGVGFANNAITTDCFFLVQIVFLN